MAKDKKPANTSPLGPKASPDKPSAAPKPKESAKPPLKGKGQPASAEAAGQRPAAQEAVRAAGAGSQEKPAAATAPAQPQSWLKRYHQASKSAFYGLVMAIPLLALYEMLVISSGNGGYVVRNAADAWLRAFFGFMGLSPKQAFFALLLGAIMATPILYKKSAPLKFSFLLTVPLEALLYSVLLGQLQGLLPRLLALPVEGTEPYQSVGSRLGQAIGAGLFEELVFRVILVYGLMALFLRFLRPGWAAGLSVVGAALIFSAAHYVGPLGDSLTLGSFLFRWLAGLLFTGLYFTRGFAVTVYTHALYDIRVMLM